MIGNWGLLIAGDVLVILRELGGWEIAIIIFMVMTIKTRKSALVYARARVALLLGVASRAGVLQHNPRGAFRAQLLRLFDVGDADDGRV